VREDGRSPIWGGATIGLFVGLILGFFVGTYWTTVLYAVGIGAAAGLASNVLAWLGNTFLDRSSSREERFEDEDDDDWAEEEQFAPLPQPRLIATADLTTDDLPQPDAASEAYHRFAATFNGEEEMGSWRLCGRTADEGLKRWRQARELPDGVNELRACLFFEHPHWHPDRADSDEESMEHGRAIVEKLRSLLRAPSGAGAP
jgi:hypothetical protein